MSDIVKRVCNRCKKEAITDEELAAAREWPMVTINNAPDPIRGAPAALVTGIHLCWECFPVFAELLPGEKLDQLARHASEFVISSGDERVKPGASISLKSEPKDREPVEWFTPNRVLILERPEDWIVNDIRIGHHSQFSQSGDVPGDLFAETTNNNHVVFERLDRWNDIEVLATYRGKNPEGGRLAIKVIGIAPGFGPVPPPVPTVIPVAKPAVR